ncbi:MAG: hypothetical protein JNK51_14290 [Blastocatellia bacterium]|nr:hypothetical protein [Chloracidobacterium sp.]MBL8186083.1 hypothetical protein [Blastocatellia bacterium]HRJ89447.1 hypothetical protein [Pyrinomonadaceae bacterium]HRK51618.1 hypothetical protein [Pyrinomonadaceae bacterium]
MLDENLIATLETSLRQTRNAQNRLMVLLREVESESERLREERERLREEIQALENSASQTESAIDSLLVSLRSGSRMSRIGREIRFEDDYENVPETRPSRVSKRIPNRQQQSNKGTVAYINQARGVPSRTNNIEPISHRFSDRTITQACTLLLREAGKPLHVNELYNLLVAGGMEFKGNNPTISVAVSLNRNRRFRKVDPGTFDLAMREASQVAS